MAKKEDSVTLDTSAVTVSSFHAIQEATVLSQALMPAHLVLWDTSAVTAAMSPSEIQLPVQRRSIVLKVLLLESIVLLAPTHHLV
jgi:hypothetical protein